MKDIILLLPEIFLVATLAGLVLGEIGYRGERVRLITPTALVGLGGAFIQTLLTYRYGATEVLGRALSLDGFSLFFKLFFIVLAMIAVVSSSHSKEISREKRAEYCALVIAAALAMCLSAAASDLLVVFLSLQFLNLVGFFLAGFGKRSVLSTEAAVKHLAFAAVAAALMLYGIATLFAATHTLNLYEMHRVLVTHPLPEMTGIVVFVLMFLSFAFQFAAFPMYLWAPDVLEGAPTPASAVIALGARAAGFAVAVRFLVVVMAQPAATPGQWQVLGGVDWTGFVATVSGLTMIIGALLAFRQSGAKRLVSYLVVAETGFLLLGLLVLDEVGIAALLYNLVVELFALMGAFYVLSFLRDELQSDRLKDLNGMLGRATAESIALVLFLACLVGLPPFPGFIGKFALIGAAIRHQWHFLAGVGIVASAISVVAVARLAYSLIGDIKVARANPVAESVPRRAFLAALFIPMVLVGIFAEQVLSWAGQSLRFILW